MLPYYFFIICLLIPYYFLIISILFHYYLVYLLFPYFSVFHRMVGFGRSGTLTDKLRSIQKILELNMIATSTWRAGVARLMVTAPNQFQRLRSDD